MAEDLKIGDRIRNLRRSKKLTQKNFAKILNVAESTVASWESGYRNPDMESLLNISNCMEVSIDWLVGKEEKNVSIKVPESGNAITIIGRNGMFKTYFIDDKKVKALEALAETLAEKDNFIKKK